MGVAVVAVIIVWTKLANSTTDLSPTNHSREVKGLTLYLNVYPERCLCFKRSHFCYTISDLSSRYFVIFHQTLSARATRLESSVSKVRLAAEKESLWRIAQAKRHRATGPKNATEFMKSTLLDRESRANAAKARATRKAGRSNLLHADNAAQAGPSNTFRCQRCTSPSSARAATIVNQTNDCHQASRFCRTSTFAPELDCGQILVDDVVPSPTKQVPPNSTARTVSERFTY